MADKLPNERDWKTFSKNAAYKGDPLARALAAAEAAGKADPQALLAALDAVDAQSAALLKANKSDKALAAYLDDLAKTVKGVRKQAQLAADKKAADEKEDTDEEPDDILLEPKRLLNELNLCRRNPERRVQFGFVDGKGPLGAYLALSAKATGRRLFARLQAATGLKMGAFGSAWVEGTVLMLQVDKPISGLVKKVRAPVKACGFRIARAVLRDAQGEVLEQDEEEPGDTGPAGTDVDAATAFKRRLAALVPGVQAARAAHHPALQAITAKIAEAGALAHGKAFDRAHALLDEVDVLLLGASDDARGDSSGTDAAQVLKYEARALLASAADASGAAFVHSIESVRIKADLLADLHGDHPTAKALVAQAFELVRQRQGQDGFDAGAHPEIGQLTDRAFKFGVLEGGLEGGSPGSELLGQAMDLADRGAADALDVCKAAIQACMLENDAQQLRRCVELCLKLGAAAGDTKAVNDTALLARRAKFPEAPTIAQEAVKFARGSNDPSALVRAIHNFRLAGGDEDEVVMSCGGAMDEAIKLGDAKSLVEAAELCHEIPGCSPDLTAKACGQVIDLVKSKGLPDTLEKRVAAAQACLRAGNLLLELPFTGDFVQKLRLEAQQAAQVSASIFQQDRDSQGLLGAAQLLAASGTAVTDTARVAFQAGGQALGQGNAEVALDAVKFLCGLTAELADAHGPLLELSDATVKLADQLKDASVPVEVAAALLGVNGKEALQKAMMMAARAADQALKTHMPGAAHGAVQILLDGAQLLSSQASTPSQAREFARYAGTWASRMEEQAKDANNEELRSMAGAQMLDAAAMIAASADIPTEYRGQAGTWAADAGRIALHMKDGDQALKAAALLARLGDAAAAEKLSVGVLDLEIVGLQGAHLAGDCEAFAESACRAVRALATLRVDARSTEAEAAVQAHQKAIVEGANALWEQNLGDLDALQALCAVLRRAGADVRTQEAFIADRCMERAAQAHQDGDYPAVVTQLRTASQLNPKLGKDAAEQASAMCSELVTASEIYDEYVLLDAADLLLETALQGSSPMQTTLEAALRIGQRVQVLPTEDNDVPKQAEALVAKVSALVSSTLTTIASGDTAPTVSTEAPTVEGVFKLVERVDDYLYSALITKARKYHDATVVHYRSAGSMTDDESKKVDAFVETAARQMHKASRELVRGAFSDWDEDGAHLVQALNLRDDWKKAAKDKAIFHDLQKLRTVQAGKPLEKKSYNAAVERHLMQAGWPDMKNFDEKRYLELRTQEHTSNPATRAYAEGRALKMLHTVAGYLIEERTYQLLPSKDVVPWTDQDTTILGGGTRPDIVLPVRTGTGGAVSALLDITASDSQGHIFDKRPMWTSSQKVCDSVEIMYASLDHGTLLSVMLENASFTDEDVERRREAVRALDESKAAASAAVKARILAALNQLQNTAFKKAVGDTGTAANHLLKHHGIWRKGFNKSMKVNPVIAAAALARLDRHMAKLPSSS